MTAATGLAGQPPTSAQTYQRLRSHLAFLKMAAAAEALPAVLDAAREDGTPPLEAIEALLAVQVNATEHRQQASRLHFANLPAPWSIDDYDFSAQPGVDEKLIRELATLRFLDDAANVILIGPPGVGKTMLGIGLARAAAEAGHKAYFTTCEELVRRLKKAITEHRLVTGSIVTTSHVGIQGWAERLGDPMLAAALIDRLLHRGILVGIDGPSYRMRSHQARADALRKTTRAGTAPRTEAAS
jgi:DNA replication protein DnaC